MAIKSSVSNYFWSTFIDSINVFGCRLFCVNMAAIGLLWTNIISICLQLLSTASVNRKIKLILCHAAIAFYFHLKIPCLVNDHDLFRWSWACFVFINWLPTSAMKFCVIFLSSADFFQINFFIKLFQEYHQSVKQFGSWSGLTFCRAWSGSKLFANIISRRHLSR